MTQKVTVDQIPPVGPGIAMTPGLIELANNDKLAGKLAVVRPELDKVFAQIQRDVITEDNMGSIGPMILALKTLNNVFRVIQDRGDAVNQANKDSTTTTDATSD